MRSLILILLLASGGGLSAQTLSMGGRLGGATARSADEPLRSDLGGEAGFFARYTTRQGRMGLKVALNYAHHPAAPDAWTLPLLPQLTLVEERVHLYAGPYTGLSRQEAEALAAGRLRLQWGFMTGLDVTIPLSRRMVLVSGAEWRSDPKSPAPGEAYWAPVRALSFSFSLGLAWRWRPSPAMKRTRSGLR